ncbi:uncharacterized protein DNG_10077 [Cephalotrichum gorgonifer]|uniref:Heterokaryon incompatibility domain-containing protein n=1 Tax=Cephalotrichum gorgonifer TaxID=2041049 RepID=A0AAE8N8H2_9PEZI|nr:uncharacterized protein DNG_10077 [Cephalotrichum gorgonifer]
MRCSYCSSLAIQKLVDLAKVEFQGAVSPRSEYYQHHASVHDLERSAQDGCDLCGLILGAFAESTSDDDWYYTREDETLLDALKRWDDETPIRISIQADHVYITAPFDDVRNFDLLQLTAGQAEEYNVEEESGDEPPKAWLLISTLTDNPPKLGDIEIGRRPTDGDLGSDGNFGTAKRWISECQSGHRDCPRANPPFLPTRVVDVGSSGASAADCRLFIPGNAVRAQYVALSHCWGGQIDCVLTKNTLTRFQDVLPREELAANFQDAIKITRKLGLQYLWIDSLCIIQDDRDDWAAESVKMADVYRNSLVTISAASSPASGHGIIRNSGRVEEPLPETEVRIQLSESDATELRVSVFPLGDKAKQEDLRSLYSHAPLSQRGWCLQESVLSPRILYYGRSRIYWRCAHGFKSSDGIHPGTKMPESSFLYPELSATLHAGGRLDRYALLKEYYGIVTDFGDRRLTVHSDKLPALSGLAQRIHTALRGDYLAGLWSTDISGGLMWVKEMRWAKHVVPYRAPSWSWAVTDDQFYFHDIDPSDADDPDKLRLLSSEIQSKDKANCYGEVLSGHIVVSGLAMELCRTFQVDTEDPESRENLGYVMWDESLLDNEKDSVGSRLSTRIVEERQSQSGLPPRLVEVIERTQFIDDVDVDHYLKEVEQVPRKEYTALLLGKRGLENEYPYKRGQCLILERTGEFSVYRRAGIASLMSYPDTKYRDWTRRTLKIV